LEESKYCESLATLSISSLVKMTSSSFFLVRIYHSAIAWNQNLGSQNKYHVMLVHFNCTRPIGNIVDNKALYEHDRLLDIL
jgi:hypothetical protein